MNKKILVMTINLDEVALRQRRHMAPPVQRHKKKKGNGSYCRRDFKNDF